MFNDFGPGETQHGAHDNAAQEGVPKKTRMGASDRREPASNAAPDPAGNGEKGKKKKDAKMSSKERVRQALNTRADSTTIIIGRSYVTEADAFLPYGTKKTASRITPKYPDMAAKQVKKLDPKLGIQPGLKAGEQPGAPQSVESLIAQGLHMSRPVQPFYELSPAEQSKIRFNLTVRRIFMCIGVSFAAGCCGGVWYYLKFKGAGDEDEDPFEPYEDLIEDQTTEGISTSTTTTTTLTPPAVCIGRYCLSTAACENFDTRIFTRIAANLSQTYAPLTTTVETITDCLNQTVFGTPQLAADTLCQNPGFGCNGIQLIPANLIPFLMGLNAKAADISCGCSLCNWPRDYISSDLGVTNCGESNARAYINGDPCGTVCGLTWPETVAMNETEAAETTTTTTSTTSTTTTTVDPTICIGPTYRPNDHFCPECTDYHSRIVATQANFLQTTSKLLVDCVKRTYQGIPQIASLGNGRTCSQQRLCFAFEVMIFEFAKTDPMLSLDSNIKCGCELCKWPRDWLSYGTGRGCLNAANIVGGKWCGERCNGTFPVGYTGDTSTWVGLAMDSVSTGNDSNSSNATRLLQSVGGDEKANAFIPGSVLGHVFSDTATEILSRSSSSNNEDATDDERAGTPWSSKKKASRPAAAWEDERADLTWGEIGLRQEKLKGFRSVFTRRVHVEVKPKIGEVLLVDYNGQWSQSPAASSAFAASSLTAAGRRKTESSSQDGDADQSWSYRYIFGDAALNPFRYGTNEPREMNVRAEGGAGAGAEEEDQFTLESEQNAGDEDWWEETKVRGGDITDNEVAQCMSGLWTPDNPRHVFSLFKLLQRVRQVRRRKTKVIPELLAAGPAAVAGFGDLEARKDNADARAVPARTAAGGGGGNARKIEAQTAPGPAATPTPPSGRSSPPEPGEEVRTKAISASPAAESRTAEAAKAPGAKKFGVSAFQNWRDRGR
eukprot:g1080.t1